MSETVKHQMDIPKSIHKVIKLLANYEDVNLDQKILSILQEWVENQKKSVKVINL